MTVSTAVPLPGCRHNVLGHALKAIGVLRSLAECASPDACDSSAEGWWDLDTGAFTIRSERYPDAETLVKFFAEKYRPTPIIAAWNKSGGVTDKIDVTISGEPDLIADFRSVNEPQLTRDGLKKSKKLSKKGALKFSADSESRASIESLIEEFNRGIESSSAGAKFPNVRRISVSIATKTTGKKDGTLPKIAKLVQADSLFLRCLTLARERVDSLQASNAAASAILQYRDSLPDSVAESLDSLSAFHTKDRKNNPLFINRGQQGNTDIFRMYWESFITFCQHPGAHTRYSLFAERTTGQGTQSTAQMKAKRSGKARGESRAPVNKGKGTPFFPDVIKNYNQGLEWMTEVFPFCPLDYLLAVEGGLAMRGAVSKGLSAQSRSFAAFPFVFQGVEAMTDDQGEVKGLGHSLWLPLWTRPTTYHELQSFILDSQARLPRRECRFSSDFARAVRSQGVDAGFEAFQEFRFKMKGARVPWAVSGRLLTCSSDARAGDLNELLGPIDTAGFLDQFRFRTSDDVNRDRKPDLHPLRAPVLNAIDLAAAEPDTPKLLDVLSRLATLNAQIARSKSLREAVGQAIFVPPLPCGNWSAALRDLEDDPEFEIARALASIAGHERQTDGTSSEVEPFQGSLVPLRRRGDSWCWPAPPESPSAQAVWTGIELPRDLAAVLARRVLDSTKDARPAVVGTCTARLGTILQFLRGELDDRRIATLVEALSLIDWRNPPSRDNINGDEASGEDRLDPAPVAYAAMRSLIEVACDHKSEVGPTSERASPHVNVQRAVALVSRQEPSMVAAATVEALRRLAISGVPNPYGAESRREKPVLTGRDVVRVERTPNVGGGLARRLAAALLVPLDGRDRWKLFRAISLPQTTP